MFVAELSFWQEEYAGALEWQMAFQAVEILWKSFGKSLLAVRVASCRPEQAVRALKINTGGVAYVIGWSCRQG
jgi:hypothetical protein